ncbi:MAG: DUF2905 domain-containing protein [Peptococcaceae bacterium]|nr:DUF2905 domain-containing protein [Peptococcaceae bacterium]
MGEPNLGKILIMLGLFLVLCGLIVLVLGKFLHLGHLPGDIFVKGSHGSFYFPVVSCIIVSIVLSIIMNLLNK